MLSSKNGIKFIPKREKPETDMTTAKYTLPKIDFKERNEE
jgi:hypothetical protein